MLTDHNNETGLGANDLRRRREERAAEIRRQQIAERQSLAVSDSDGGDSDDDSSIAVRGSNLPNLPSYIIVMQACDPHPLPHGVQLHLFPEEPVSQG